MTIDFTFNRITRKALRSMTLENMKNMVKMQIYDALPDFVPFVQFKKRQKHIGKSVTSSLQLKVTLFQGCFSRFFDCINDNKSSKASQIFDLVFIMVFD